MDSRRRNGPSRPLSSEEVDCWGHATTSLRLLSTYYSKGSSNETLGRVNRLISAWPTDETLPTEGLGHLRNTYQKLTAGLQDITSTAKQEIDALDDAIERVGVLIALRNASELGTLEKRAKRPRAPSPSGTPLPQSASGNGRSVSITLPPRTNSVGPTSNLRDSRTKKDGLFTKQHPLPLGRKVVFKPPKSANAEEGAWIFSMITRVINSSKEGIKYEVQDLEPQEAGQFGAIYPASPKFIVPLPEEGAAAGSPAHLSNYPICPVGTTVLALYPDTSCFYRGEVLEPPHIDKSSSNKFTPMYRIKFEEDDDLEHPISVYSVVQFPPQFLNAPK